MSVGIFAWAALEPEEGKYDFTFLDKAMDDIYARVGYYMDEVSSVTMEGIEGSEIRPHRVAQKAEGYLNRFILSHGDISVLTGRE